MSNNTKTEFKKKKIEHLRIYEALTHKFDSYCCPCCPLMPEIKCFDQVLGTVKFYCKEHGENTLDVEDFIEKIGEFENNCELKVNNKCKNHKNEYEFYCLDCQENICEKCIKETNEHENHKKYEICGLNPEKKEILYIESKIEMLLQEKDELLRKLKTLESKIIFYDTLINSYEKREQNYLLNLNLKHLVYGEDLDFDEIKNAEFAKEKSKRDLFDNLIKNEFKKATEGLNQLILVDKKIGNELLDELKTNIKNGKVFEILQSIGQVKEPAEIIDLKNLKILNLRGNSITSLEFLKKSSLPVLEIISLNDNEINSIDNLKTVSFPKLKEFYLSKNYIDNIEPLAELKTPELRILWLANNNISSIKILQNVNFPKLLKLSLSKNKISDISVFEKRKAKFPQLYELYLNDNIFEIKKYNKAIENLFIKVRQFYY